MRIEKPSSKQLWQILAAGAGTFALIAVFSNLSVADPYSARLTSNEIISEDGDVNALSTELRIEDYVIASDSLLNRGGVLGAEESVSSDETANTEPEETAAETDDAADDEVFVDTEVETTYPETQAFASVYTNTFNVPALDKPAADATSVTTFKRGTQLQQVAVSGDYSRVLVRNGLDLTDYYIESSYLTQTYVFPEYVATLYNHTDGAYTHVTNDADSEVPLNLELGASVDVIGRSDDWYEIAIDDQSVYLKEWYLMDAAPTATPMPTATPVPTATPAPTAAPKPTQAPAKAAAPAAAAPAPASNNGGNVGSAVVNTALAMQGPQGGYDCSSFVQEVYRRIGISIPRSTHGYGSGQSVSWANIAPGDLILYDSLGVGYTTHVAIYVGNGNVVHVNTVQGKIKVQGYQLGAGSYPITGIKRYR